MTHGPLQWLHESQTVATRVSKPCSALLVSAGNTSVVLFFSCSVSVFVACFLNAAHVLSNWCRCFLNLLVFRLFASVFFSCCSFAPVSHHTLVLQTSLRNSFLTAKWDLVLNPKGLHLLKMSGFNGGIWTTNILIPFETYIFHHLSLLNQTMSLQQAALWCCT